MTYETPRALRNALEHRLLAMSTASGIGLDRLRRRVLFERIVARLDVAEPGSWVLKGGMALEVRLRDDARLTKDIDLGLRDEVRGPVELHERLVEALSTDPDHDGFRLTTSMPTRLREDGGGQLTWRVRIAANLAEKPFGGIQVDVSPRAWELDTTERLSLPNALGFAGIPAREIEVIDVNRHAAEKFHAMLRDFGERENSRVRDLLDLVILIEHALLTPALVASAAEQVWAGRDGRPPPDSLPPLPESWPHRYERLAADNDVDVRSYLAAVAMVAQLWEEMFPTKEM